MLTDDQIIRFQKLWKEHFGEEITRTEALEHGLKLIRLLQIILKND
jgi:hypothetical protein